MAITPGQYSQLVSAAVLQDYIVDKDSGTPLAGGFISMFVDTSRTTFKNWYYQVGTPGNYTYIPLDNPLTLSSVGTIQDPNGNDVIPFYYPFDENNPTQRQAYFVQVNSANQDGSMGALQFTRENFPFGASTFPPITTPVPTNENYIINNEFWRNIGTVSPNTAGQTVIAPSQHDSLEYPDIRWVKAAGSTSTDMLTFNKFTSDLALTNDVTPEFYLNVQCTAGAAETNKYLQIPITTHIATLSGESASISFQAMNVGSSPNALIQVGVLAGTGTGAVNLDFIVNYGTPIPIGNGWQKYTIPEIILPSLFDPPIAIGAGGDDGLYLVLQFPIGTTEGAFNMNIAKPQIYIAQGAQPYPTNQFDTYDQLDSIINSWRTGDVRTSLNAFAPFGWVLCNDGVISNGSNTIVPPLNGTPVARNNVDTWPLFNLIWTNTNVTVAPIYDATGNSSIKGVTAIADFNAGKQLTLTLTLGRALLGLPPAGISDFYTTGNGQFTTSNYFTNYVYVGTPILVSGSAIPSAFTANTIYYGIPVDTTHIALASSYANALTGTAITGGTAGTPNFTLTVALGGAFGQAQHVQLTAEVGPHTHTGTYHEGAAAGVNDSAVQSGTQTALGNVTIATNTPNSAPFNIVQPSVYYNVFMKL